MEKQSTQAGLTDERSPLIIAFEKYCHTLMKFKHRVTPEMWPKSWPWFEAGYLAAHSADARNGEGVVLMDERKAFDAWASRHLRMDGYPDYSAWDAWKARARLAAPAAPAPKLTPHTADVEQMLDCDEAPPAPAAQADGLSKDQP